MIGAAKAPNHKKKPNNSPVLPHFARSTKLRVQSAKYVENPAYEVLSTGYGVLRA